MSPKTLKTVLVSITMLRIVLVVGGLRSGETLLLAIISALDLVQIASE